MEEMLRGAWLVAEGDSGYRAAPRQLPGRRGARFGTGPQASYLLQRMMNIRLCVRNTFVTEMHEGRTRDKSANCSSADTLNFPNPPAERPSPAHPTQAQQPGHPPPAPLPGGHCPSQAHQPLWPKPLSYPALEPPGSPVPRLPASAAPLCCSRGSFTAPQVHPPTPLSSRLSPQHAGGCGTCLQASPPALDIPPHLGRGVCISLLWVESGWPLSALAQRRPGRNSLS